MLIEASFVELVPLFLLLVSKKMGEKNENSGIEQGVKKPGQMKFKVPISPFRWHLIGNQET